VPVPGGSTVVAFFGQPARSAAAANKQAIDTIFFILNFSARNAGFQAGEG
jgi:hypothetical protein